MKQKQLIISVGREFGSGGHEIAQKLAERFHLPLYDHNLLREIAEEKGVPLSGLAPYDEIPTKGFLYRNVRGYSNSPQENIAYMQFEHLRKMADEGQSFVIVGRCAEQILEDVEGLISVFILADSEKKVERIMTKYDLSEHDAEKLIITQNKKRKAYHNHFCVGKWGDSRTYDLCINSSHLGIDGTADALEDYINRRIANR